MTTHTLSFTYDIFFIVKQLLDIYIDKTLHNFDMKEVSHINSINKYNIPKFIPYTIYEFMDELTNDEIETVMKSLHDGKSDTFIVDEHIPEIFKALTQTEKFTEKLNSVAIKTTPIHNYVIDTTTNNIYKAKFGEHLRTIKEIIKTHPELDTIEKQDDFVMNKLKLGGNKMHKTWYQPKKVVLENTVYLKDKLLKYDTQSVFEKIYNDILESNKSRPDDPKTDISIYIDCYEEEKVLHIISHDTKKLVKFLTNCDLQEDINDWDEILNEDIITEYNHVKDYVTPKHLNCEIVNIYRQNTYKENLAELEIYQELQIIKNTENPFVKIIHHNYNNTDQTKIYYKKAVLKQELKYVNDLYIIDIDPNSKEYDALPENATQLKTEYID